jgi:prevent-host-death family protein
MRVNAAEVEKDFGAFERKAREEPVEIERDGEPSVVLVSAEEWARLREHQRRALYAWELNEEEVEALRSAEIPPEHRWRSDDPD